jgi:hypothetical protein
VQWGVVASSAMDPRLGPARQVVNIFVQGVRVIAVYRIEMQVVDVEARQESFLYCCGGVVVAQVECVARSSHATIMHHTRKCA